MKQGSTLFLRAVVYLIGLTALGLCVFALPAGIMSDETGGYYLILLGMYVTAVPFFIALFQTLKLLHYIDTKKAFSILSVNALKYIKYCAITISGLYVAGMPYIFYVADTDDAPGVVVIGLGIIGASFTIGIFAAVLQRILRDAIAIKSENDLTV